MNSPVTVREISSKADKQKFVRMVWDIYGDDPNWVPPIEMDRMKLIDEQKNPFFSHAKVKWFLAERDGKAVGRIAAVINDHYIKAQEENGGFFGFFECIDDVMIARALFERAEAFLRQNGMVASYGPASPSSNDEYGLLVEGFDRPPVLLLTYNPPYYEKLIQAAGYGKHQDLYAYLLSQETARSDK